MGGARRQLPVGALAGRRPHFRAPVFGNASRLIVGRKWGAASFPATPHYVEPAYALTCLAMCLFISNIEHLSTPNTFFSLSSAKISRLLAGFCRLFFLMWSHTLLIT